MLTLLSNAAWGVLAVATVWILLRASRSGVDPFSLAALAGVASSGLALNGWTVADEVLVGAVLGGALLRRERRGTDQALSRSVLGHGPVFMILCAYLCLQSVRGVVDLIDAGSFLDGVRKVRWPLFFVALVWLARLRRRGALPEGIDWPVALSKIGVAYMGVYVGTGMVAEAWLGIDRYSLQPGMAQYSGENLSGFALFGSSAYAMFPALVMVPAGLMLIGRSGRPQAWLGGAAVGSVLLAGLYYDSRVSLLFLAVMIAASIPSALRSNPRRLLASAGVYLLLLAAFFALQPQRTGDLLSGLLVTGGAVWAEDTAPASSRDVDRVAHVQAGLEASSENWFTFFFGHGYRMSSFVVGPYFYDILTLQNASASTDTLDNFATEGFTALLVDTGWIGVALLSCCLTLAAAEIVKRVGVGDRILMLAALGGAAGWLVVINMLDIVMFYLLFMPDGLLVRLGVAAHEARVPSQDSMRVGAHSGRSRPRPLVQSGGLR